MTTYYTGVSFLDVTSQPSTVQVETQDPADVNYGGVGISFETVRAAWQSSLAAITYCNPIAELKQTHVNKISNAKASDPQAVRELKLRWVFEDQTDFSKVSITTPGPKSDTLTFDDNSDRVNVTLSASGAALQAFIDNTIKVMGSLATAPRVLAFLYVEKVGRNT